MGYRIQHNNAIGLTRGIRFHASVSQSIPEVSTQSAERTAKLSLTTSPMGGAPHMDPTFSQRGKSDMKVMHFCWAFNRRALAWIGPDAVVPPATLAWAAVRWASCMWRMQKLAASSPAPSAAGVANLAGSLSPPGAAGFGNVYFLLNMLRRQRDRRKGKRVARYIRIWTMWPPTPPNQAPELGAKAVRISTSDSDGSIVVPDGLTHEQLEYILELKNIYRGRHTRSCRHHIRRRKPTIRRAPSAPCRPQAYRRPASRPQNEIDGTTMPALLCRAGGV